MIKLAKKKRSRTKNRYRSLSRGISVLTTLKLVALTHCEQYYELFDGGTMLSFD